MESGDGREITWDVENRPVSITKDGVTTSFVYDGDGNRVKKTVGGVATIYVNKYYEKTGDNVTTSYYLGSKLIAVKTGADLSYLMQDHLGSTSGTTNSSETVTITISYFSFGSVRSSTGASPTDKKFTGQRLDNTGLYYYNARYYDPTIGRFISADTIVPNFTNPQSLNRYSYCLNNPLKYIDPSGHAGEGLPDPYEDGQLGYTIEGGWVISQDGQWVSLNCHDTSPPDYDDYVRRIKTGSTESYSIFLRNQEFRYFLGDKGQDYIDKLDHWLSRNTNSPELGKFAKFCDKAVNKYIEIMTKGLSITQQLPDNKILGAIAFSVGLPITIGFGTASVLGVFPGLAIGEINEAITLPMTALGIGLITYGWNTLAPDKYHIFDGPLPFP